jgi:hypothetical protein
VVINLKLFLTCENIKHVQITNNRQKKKRKTKFERKTKRKMLIKIHNKIEKL